MTADYSSLKNERLELFGKLFILLQKSSRIHRFTDLIRKKAQNDVSSYNNTTRYVINSKPLQIYKGTEIYCVAEANAPSTVLYKVDNTNALFFNKNTTLKKLTFNPKWRVVNVQSSITPPVVSSPPFTEVEIGTTFYCGIPSNDYSGFETFIKPKGKFYLHDNQYATWSKKENASFLDYYFWDSSTSLSSDIYLNNDVYFTNMNPSNPPVGVLYYVQNGVGDFSGLHNVYVMYEENWDVSDEVYNYDWSNAEDIYNKYRIVDDSILSDPENLYSIGLGASIVLPISYDNLIYKTTDITDSTFVKLRGYNFYDYANREFIVSNISYGDFEYSSNKLTKWSEVEWGVKSSSDSQINTYTPLSQGYILASNGSDVNNIDVSSIFTSVYKRNPKLNPICNDKFIIDTSSVELDDTLLGYYNFNKLASYDRRWVYTQNQLSSETYVQDQVNNYETNELKKICNELDIPLELGLICLGEKNKTLNYFKKVVDVPIHDSKDHRRMRRMMIDMYSALKTFIVQSKKLVNVDSLTTDELNEMIMSFGFPYPHEIPTKNRKQQFLTNLISFYQGKGTASVFLDALQLYGLNNVVLSEWWIYYDKYVKNSDGSSIGDYVARSKVIEPSKYINDPIYFSQKSYDDFVQLAKPYWQLSKDELNDLYLKNPVNRSMLPALSPYISLNVALEIGTGGKGSVTPTISILQEKLKETVEYWLKYCTVKTINPDTTSVLNIKDKLRIINTEIPVSERLDYDGYYVCGSSIGPSGDIDNNNWYIRNLDNNLVSINTIKKMIIGWNKDVNEWYVLDTSNYSVNDWYIFDESSSELKNSLAKISNIDTSSELNSITWTVEVSIGKDSIIQDSDSSNHLIYNGERWVDLGCKIPEYILSDNSSTQATKKSIVRDMTLDDFDGFYSFSEVMMAISYLFEGFYSSDTDITKKYWQYNGEQNPLDSEYNRDDVDELLLDPNKYSPITQKYYQITEDKDNGITYNKNMVPYRHDFRKDVFQNSYNINESYFDYDTSTVKDRITTRRLYEFKEYELNNNFTKEKNYSDISWLNTAIVAQRKSGNFIEAMNPLFKEQLDIQSKVNKNLIIENLLLDLEYYCRYILEILDSFFTYAIMGGVFYSEYLKPVIDFFKPYRVRLLEFGSILQVKDSLNDYVPIGDNVIQDLEYTHVDDKLWRYTCFDGSENETGYYGSAYDISGRPKYEYDITSDVNPYNYFDSHYEPTGENRKYRDVRLDCPIADRFDMDFEYFKGDGAVRVRSTNNNEFSKVNEIDLDIMRLEDDYRYFIHYDLMESIKIAGSNLYDNSHSGQLVPDPFNAYVFNKLLIDYFEYDKIGNKNYEVIDFSDVNNTSFNRDIFVQVWKHNKEITMRKCNVSPETMENLTYDVNYGPIHMNNEIVDVITFYITLGSVESINFINLLFTMLGFDLYNPDIDDYLILSGTWFLDNNKFIDLPTKKTNHEYYLEVASEPNFGENILVDAEKYYQKLINN